MSEQITQLLALSLLYVATVTSYGSARVRGGGARLTWLDSPQRRLWARGAALLATLVAATLWHSIEPGPAAVLVVIVMLMAAGTCTAVLGAIAPRAVWGSALLALLLIPVLTFARGALP